MPKYSYIMLLLLLPGLACKKSSSPAPPPASDCLITGVTVGSNTGTIVYNTDKTVQSITEFGWTVQYQYTGNVVIMTAYSGSVAAGKVKVVKSSGGLIDSLYALALNTDGTVANWQTYAYVYNGHAVTKALETSSFPGDSSHEFDYNYTDGQLKSISISGDEVMNFTYQSNSLQAQGDFFWQQNTFYLPLCYQGPSTSSPFILPIQGQGLCSAIGNGNGTAEPCTYTYDSENNISTFISSIGSASYTYSCPN